MLDACPHALQVRGQHLGKGGRITRVDCDRVLGSGVVHRTVQGAELVDRPIHETRDLLLLRDVGEDENGLPTPLLDGLRRRGTALGVDVVDDDAGPPSREVTRYRLTASSRRAGDQHNLARAIVHAGNGTGPNGGQSRVDHTQQALVAQCLPPEPGRDLRARLAQYVQREGSGQIGVGVEQGVHGLDETARGRSVRGWPTVA